MIKLSPLFSGSHGNCTLIQSPKANILLDMGVSCRAVTSQLAVRGLAPKDICAVVVTHEHSDHIFGLKTWVHKNHTPVFAPSACISSISRACEISEILPSDDGIAIADIQVDVYVCSHDARACFGYRFADGDSAVASVTDTGVATNRMVQFLAPCKTIMLESNHDPDMLRTGDYPAVLKRRIASELGHLSNVQATEVLKRLIGSNVKNVVLAHLSENNNTKAAALASAEKMYLQNNVEVGKDVFLFVADQHNNEVTL